MSTQPIDFQIPTPHCALVAVMRDEGPYLLEWIAYHRLIGFDEIIIYDNASKDETAELGQRLERAGIIRYRQWPDPAAETGVGPQVPAYQDAVRSTTADWLCFLDADEFLVLVDYPSVGALIQQAGQAGMPIALNWKIFGSSGALHQSSLLVIERFVRCGLDTEDVNRHIKTLGPRSVLNRGAQVHVHGWVLTGPDQYYVDATGMPVDVAGCTFVTPPRWRGAWINHYIVKSLAEFEKKRLRGKATHPVGSPDKYDRTYKGYFLQYDRNEMEDRTAEKFVFTVLREIQKLKCLISKL